MFTGIIEETGTVSAVIHGARSAQLKISASKVLENTAVGDSIAVNGVCLTVTHKNNNEFSADVMAETMRRSSLGNLKKGSIVNLERAMPANGRFGGHIVSGHIDGLGTISDFKREDNAVWITLNADKSILKYIVMKGSVAIDGVSLTVAGLDSNSFSVSVIPHTQKETILLSKNKGDTVNLECDIIGKYVERFLNLSAENTSSENSSVTYKFLSEHGFI